jgi:hypothetical protein
VRQVLATTNRSLLESARLALAAEDIETVVTNDNAALPFTPLTLAVLHDEDSDQAVAIVGALELGAAAPPRSSRVRRYSWLILILLFGAILCICEPAF